MVVRWRALPWVFKRAFLLCFAASFAVFAAATVALHAIRNRDTSNRGLPRVININAPGMNRSAISTWGGVTVWVERNL